MKLQFFFLSASLFSISAFANVYDQLSEPEKKIVHSGKQLTYFEEVKGEIWPKSRVYQKVNALPEEAMGVIADYGQQVNYVHRVAGSIPHDTPDPAVKIIDYKMDLPFVVRPFFSPDYQMKNTIDYLGEAQGFQMKWQLIDAISIREIEGGALVEPLPDGGSLVYYENFIAPKADNVILRSAPVLTRVKRGGGEVLQSMINHIESEKIKQSALFQEQVNRFKAIFIK